MARRHTLALGILALLAIVLCVATGYGLVLHVSTLGPQEPGARVPPLEVILESGRDADGPDDEDTSTPDRSHPFNREGALEIAGHALLRDGRPAAGAEIRVAHADETDSMHAGTFCTAGEAGEFRAEVQRRGAFEVDAMVLVEAEVWSGTAYVEAGDGDVEVRLYDERWREAGLAGKAPGTESVDVRVLGPSGAPVRSGRVLFLSFDEGHGWNNVVLPLVEGHCAWNLDPEDALLPDRDAWWTVCMVEVLDARWGDGPGDRCDRFVHGVLDPGARSLEVRVTAGTELPGRCVDQDGVPVAGVQVRLCPLDEFDRREFAAPEAITSAADGTFRFVGIGPGDFRVFCEQPEGYAEVAEQRLAAGAERLDILVERRLDVVVELETPQGRPAEGAIVYVYERSGLPGISPRQASGTADADGRALLKGLAEGVVYSLRAESPERRWPPVDISAWEASDTRIRFDPARSLRVKVVDESGRPFAGAHVRVIRPGPLEERVTAATVGDEGTFLFTGLPVADLAVYAMRPFGVSRTPDVKPTAANAGDGEVELVLSRGSTMTVRIRGYEKSWSLSIAAAASDDLEPAYHSLEEDGTCTVTGLRPGAVYNLYVRDWRDGRQALLRGVRPGDSLPDIEMQPGATVVVHTRLPAGADRATVALLVDKTVMIDSPWDEAKGAHVARGVPEGTWTAVAYMQFDGKYWAGTAKVKAGGECTIDLR